MDTADGVGDGNNALRMHRIRKAVVGQYVAQSCGSCLVKNRCADCGKLEANADIVDETDDVPLFAASRSLPGTSISEACCISP